jgi:hypothetical protein
MHVCGCGMNNHDRRAEQVHAISVPNAKVETVPAATRLGPVADTNHALIPEIEELSSGEELDRFVVELGKPAGRRRCLACWRRCT